MSTLSIYENTYFYIFKDKTFVEKHKHKAYELIYYIEGSGVCATENNVYAYNSLDYFICPPETVHWETHETTTSVICITFFIPEKTQLDENIYYDFNKNILAIATQIKNEAYNKPLHYDKMLTAMTEKLLIELIRSITEKNANDNEVLKVRKYINENFQYDISVEDMAKQAGYSYDYFRHIFKKQTGVSPKRYLINKRLNHAKKLLSTSTMLISDVSMLSGFPDIAEFSMLFKKNTGISPSEYRKRLTEVLLLNTDKKE